MRARGAAAFFQETHFDATADMWLGEPCQPVIDLIVEALNKKFPTDPTTPSNMRTRLGCALLNFEAFPNFPPTIDVEPIVAQFLSGPRLVLSDENRVALHVAVLVLNVLPYEEKQTNSHRSMWILMIFHAGGSRCCSIQLCTRATQAALVLGVP